MITIGLLVGAAVIAVVVVSRNLNTGWVKERLRGITGIDLDYTDAKLNLLKGIHLNGLTVASPEKWRSIAPLLLQAGGLDLGWSLFSKNGTLQTVIAKDVEITLVVDENGHSSLEGLRASGEKQPEAPEPAPTPGHLLPHIMESVPSFGHIAFQRANLNLLRTHGGAVIERSRLTGLALDARSRHAGNQQQIRALIGSKKAPEQLALTWHGQGTDAGDAAGRVWLDAELDPQRTEVHGEIVYDKQTLSKDWPKKATLLAVDAKAHAEHDKLAVELDRFELIEQSVTARGSIDVEPGHAHVLKAQGTVELDRLLRWAPKGLVPVEVREGRARYDVALLEVSASPSLDPHGRLEIDGVLSGVRLTGSTALELDQAKLEVRGKPTAHGGLHLTAELPAGALHVAAAGAHGNLSGVHLSASATFAPGQPGQVDTRLRFAQVAGDGPPGQLAATSGDLTLKVSDLAVDEKNIGALDGTVKLTGQLASFDARRPEARTHAADVKLEAHTKIVKGVPESVELALPLGTLEVAGRTETLLPPGPAKLGLRIDHVQLDRAAPARSSVDGRVDVTVGPITLGADVKKHAEAVDFDVALDARRTSLLTVFAPESLALPGARMAVKLGLKGRVEGDKVKAQATVHVDRPSVTLAEQVLSATQLDATVSVDGTPQRQKLSFTLAPQSLSLDDEALGSGHLTAQASWDLARPSLELHLDGQGDALPQGKLALTASVDKKTRALTYAIDGDLGHLAALGPMLPASLTEDHWIDLSDLRARIQSHGTLTGLLRAVDRRGVPVVKEHPLETLSGDDVTELELDHVHYVDVSGVELTVPRLEVSARAGALGEKRNLQLRAHLQRASLVVGEHHLDVTELRDEVHLAAAGDPRSAELDAKHTLAIDKLAQDWLPAYHVGGLRWSGRARRGSDGTLHVDDVVLENPGGGTRLTVSGSLILPRTVPIKQASARAVPLVGFRSMTLNTQLEQKLDALSGDPKRFKGSGSVSLSADVASGDLNRFHLITSTKLHRASLELPASHFSVVNLDGALPVVQDLRVDGKKVSFADLRETNAYPTLRFSDQHPFLSGSGGLTADAITVGNLTFEKVAGNLRVQRNQLSIDQLEAQARGGQIAGQCVLLWKGMHSTMQLRLRMTGIEALHGGKKERFDGNAALAFSVADRTVEGRAEIVRIGRHHLYDLLDEYDPHHTDAPTNRVRTALELGYPGHVRVLLDRGFASYSITFGGLARLVTVHDVHGIPTGPLVDRYLGPLFSEDKP